MPSLFRIVIFKLTVSEELTYLRPKYSPILIFSIISLRIFTYKNKNGWTFLSSCFAKFFQRPNLLCSGRSRNVHGSTRAWRYTFFVPSVCDLRKGQFLFLLWTLWHGYLIRIGNKRILCNHFPAPSKWLLPSNYLKCATNMSSSSHGWEFPLCFHTLSIVNGIDNWDWGQYASLVQKHCFQAMRG